MHLSCAVRVGIARVMGPRLRGDDREGYSFALSRRGMYDRNYFPNPLGAGETVTVVPPLIS